MSERITDKHLQSLCDHLNKITGAPVVPWNRSDTGLGANVGNYHISHAYGGVCLQRMSNIHGGVSCPLSNGHGTKRELYNELRAFIRGIELQLEANCATESNAG